MPSSALAETHPGLSVRGGKFFPWTAGLQQKGTGQIGSGMEAEAELALGGSNPTWVATQVFYCRSLCQCSVAITEVMQLLRRHSNSAVTR